MLQQIYIDTSVIGGCLDKEFSKWSGILIDDFKQGKKTAIVSDLTLLEIDRAPDNVKRILESIPKHNIAEVHLTDEAGVLAENYMKAKAVARKHSADAQHIAIASVERADLLVSWNFKQIVNVNRIRIFNSVNVRLGYPVLEIRSPREVVDEK